MKRKQKSKRKPTEKQSLALRRIEQNGGFMQMFRVNTEISSYKDSSGKTVIVDSGERYQDLCGVRIPAEIAKQLIAKEYVEPQKDSLFDMKPQTWRVKKVKNGV